TPAGSSRLFQVLSGSTIGNGAWIFSPTTRWSSKNSSTKCASTKPALWLVFSEPFSSGFASQQTIWAPCLKAKHRVVLKLTSETFVRWRGRKYEIAEQSCDHHRRGPRHRQSLRATICRGRRPRRHRRHCRARRAGGS